MPEARLLARPQELDLAGLRMGEELEDVIGQLSKYCLLIGQFTLRMSWTLTHHSDCSEVITWTGAGARPSRGEL